MNGLWDNYKMYIFLKKIVKDFKIQYAVIQN